MSLESDALRRLNPITRARRFKPKSDLTFSHTGWVDRLATRRWAHSYFVSRLLEVCGHRVVPGTRQDSAQIDKLLSIDVLVVRTREHLSLLANAEEKHIVVLLF